MSPCPLDARVIELESELTVSRANAALPPSKRHHMPESRAEPVLPRQPVASGSRHPALPAETWTTVFPDHFRNYRSVSSPLFPNSMEYRS